MTDLHYHLLDVFTDTPLLGNPLAVFPDSGGISDDVMQRIARELNLSETVFIVPSRRADCVARLRIFTPAFEMQFAGHPTVGAAFALYSASHDGTQSRSFAVEEEVGSVPVRIDEGDSPLIWLSTPPIRVLQEADRVVAAQSVGLDAGDVLERVPCELLSAGNPTLYIAVRDKEAVDRAVLDEASYRKLAVADDRFCIEIFTPVPEGAYSRVFAPGIGEDPATGSATGPLAAYMMRHDLAPSADGTRFVSEQGTKMGRKSLLHVRIRGTQGSEGIDVGGQVCRIGSGVLTL